MFVFEKDCKVEVLPNGVVRIIKGYINDLMAVHLKWKKGMVGEVHIHPHSQCVYVLKGSFEASIEEEKAVLHAGDCMYAKGDLPHGLVALEDDSEIIDIFSPYREDFLTSQTT